MIMISRLVSKVLTNIKSTFCKMVAKHNALAYVSRTNPSRYSLIHFNRND